MVVTKNSFFFLDLVKIWGVGNLKKQMLDTPSYSYNKVRHETLLLELLGKCGWELQLNLFYIYN